MEIVFIAIMLILLVLMVGVVARDSEWTAPDIDRDPETGRYDDRD